MCRNHRNKSPSSRYLPIDFKPNNEFTNKYPIGTSYVQFLDESGVKIHSVYFKLVPAKLKKRHFPPNEKKKKNLTTRGGFFFFRQNLTF